jgi:oxygen-independent coproporphyrinogen-3 oxidase
VASLKKKDVLVDAIIKEINLRKSEWINADFDTLYFGGGTPTVLTIDEISRIIKCIKENYTVNKNAEVTIEANPDDLTPDYLQMLRQQTPVNRLSIGIQSFRDTDLHFMHRRHKGEQSVNCVLEAKNAGFSNITIDLIYGIPGLDNRTWEKNIETFLSLNIPHLSAYHLSIEPKTVFGVMQKRNKLKAIDEDRSLEQYDILNDKLRSAGFQHYEISNFAKEHFKSQHNSAYWNGTPYIGIGPSAHSYDGAKRRWNVANNTVYCESLLKTNQLYFEEEILSTRDSFNDYIITALRTSSGASLKHIENAYGKKYLEHCFRVLEKTGPSEFLSVTDNHLYLSEKGWFVADYLMTEFIDA